MDYSFSYFKSFLKNNNINSDRVKVMLDFGQMSLMTTLGSSFMPIALIIIASLSLGPAKHIIMGDFGYADPTSTTAIILIYTYLVTAIFFYEQTNYLTRKDNNSLPDLYTIFQFIISALPLLLWLLIILFNNPTDKWASLFVTIFGCIALIRFFLEIRGNTDTTLTTNFLWIGIGFSFLLLFYNILLYLFGLDCLDNNYRYQTNFSWRAVSSITGTVLLCMILPSIPELYKKYNGKIAKISLLILILASLVFFSMRGAINTLDILLIFAIFMRLVLYGAGFTLKFLKNLFSNSEKKRPERVRDVALDFLKIFPFIIFLFIIFSTKSYLIHQMEPQKVTEYSANSNESIVYIEDYFEQWISHRANNNEPIVLISGQGGGSRAGCAIYYTMGVLDTLPEIKNNLLLATTISGSSNGAGFYLSAKTSKPDSLLSDHVIKKLYTEDYISKLLFRMLFVDPLYLILPEKISSWLSLKGRNKFLPEKEIKTISEALKINNLLISKKWDKNSFKPEDDLPLFLPATYNISKSMKAISSPLPFKHELKHKTYSILDSLDRTKQTITVGESILLSQMFPLVNANAILNDDVYIDGGVYDNYGFETLLDLYDVVSEIRYKVAPKKAILIISVLNSKIYNHADDNRYEQNGLKNTISAVSNSIFVSNPTRNLDRLINQTKHNGDHIEMLEIYNKSQKPKDKRQKYLFKYVPDSSSIMMSRYLHASEIDSIKSFAQREINQKIVNNTFTKTKHVLLFDFRSSTLDKEAIGLLKNIKNDMTDRFVNIVGYSDNRGSPKANQKLALKRANSVKNHILQHQKSKVAGISASAGQHDQHRDGIFERIYDRKCIISLDSNIK